MVSSSSSLWWGGYTIKQTQKLRRLKRKGFFDRRRDYFGPFSFLGQSLIQFSFNFIGFENLAAMLFEGLTKKPPSLVDLCVRLAIDNVQYIEYVGGVDFRLLDQILRHCTLEQLMHIEDCTQDTDLSPVTNKFWKRFCEKQFSEEDLNTVMKEMKCNKNFKWRDSYEASLIAVQEEEKVLDHMSL